MPIQQTTPQAKITNAKDTMAEIMKKVELKTPSL